MAPRKVASPRRSAKYYRENPEARAKKKAYDTRFNEKPEQRAKRSENSPPNDGNEASPAKAAKTYHTQKTDASSQKTRPPTGQETVAKNR
jgi:hypothetical protein